MPQTSSSQLYLNELCLNFHSRTWLNVPAKFRTTHLDFRLLHRLLLQSAGCKCFQITNLLRSILFLHLYDVYGRSHQECFFTDFGRTQISTILYSFDAFDKVLLKLKELSHSKKRHSSVSDHGSLFLLYIYLHSVAISTSPIRFSLKLK